MLTDRAIISPCGQYRYELRREWAPMLDSSCMTFIMLNPSTADATQDDPTIRRCIGFARREKCTGIRVLNLFAFRATYPQDLLVASDPVGPENDSYLQRIPDDGIIVLAWGSMTTPTIRKRREVVLQILSGKTLWCLGKNADGQPKHPLYIPGNARIIKCS